MVGTGSFGVVFQVSIWVVYYWQQTVSPLLTLFNMDEIIMLYLSRQNVEKLERSLLLRKFSKTSAIRTGSYR